MIALIKFNKKENRNCDYQREGSAGNAGNAYA